MKRSTPVPISAKVEADLAELDPAEAAEYLEAMGLSESGLARLVREAYALLGLQSFFTSGETESRAWTVPIGAKAPQAAGVIHSDFERGFIKAETASFADYVANGGEKGRRRDALQVQRVALRHSSWSHPIGSGAGSGLAQELVLG